MCVCVCVCVYTHIYACTFMYTHSCMHIFIVLFPRLSLSLLSLSLYTPIYEYVFSRAWGKFNV